MDVITYADDDELRRILTARNDLALPAAVIVPAWLVKRLGLTEPERIPWGTSGANVT